MKAYWYPHQYNVGDTLTPHILKALRPDLSIEWVSGPTKGKLVGIGSIMKHIQPGDVIFGSGVMRESDRFPQASQCSFLAVRGPLSREILVRDGGVVPEIYGDPALLLPLIYDKPVKVTHAFGIVPHYVDKKFYSESDPRMIIDVARPWTEFIDQVRSCERIISSSLHGIVIAEAYGIPAEWVEYSDKVIGKGFKFRDYLEGTGRKAQGPGVFPMIEDLAAIQAGLIGAAKKIPS